MLSKPSSPQQTAKGAERLCTLYSILPGLPKKHFNLRLWRGTKEGSPNVPAERLVSKHCGTQACAVGWAGSHPDFFAEGFYIHSTTFSSHPRFNGFSHWDAVQEFFGVPGSVATYLFGRMPVDYPHPGRNDTLLELDYVNGRVPNHFDERVQVMRRILVHFYVQGMLTPGRYRELIDLMREEVIL